MKTLFNHNYFDNIDTPNKAYWIGFIWCDGSVMTRKRENSSEYLLKIDLMYQDEEHLKKLNKDLDSEYKVKIYKGCNGFKKDYKICRLSIYDKHFVLNLINRYGIFSHRTDITFLLLHIPNEYKRDFIRGVLDADGSFHKYKTKDNGSIRDKFNLRFGGSPELLRYIEDYLIEKGIINDFKRKISKRHEDRDGNYFQITLSGKQNVMNTLSLLYDNSNISLNRKYDKYINMKGGDANVNQE